MINHNRIKKQDSHINISKIPDEVCKFIFLSNSSDCITMEYHSTFMLLLNDTKNIKAMIEYPEEMDRTDTQVYFIEDMQEFLANVFTKFKVRGYV